VVVFDLFCSISRFDCFRVNGNNCVEHLSLSFQIWQFGINTTVNFRSSGYPIEYGLNGGNVLF
jgi:hypothetical protein